MGAARPEMAGTGNGAALLLQRIPTLGLWAFGVLFAAFFFSPYWLVINLVHTLWWEGPGWTSAEGVNMGRDFVAFYSAADLTLNGDPAGAYDHKMVHAVQQSTIGAPTKFFPWFYPPTMLLLVAPLALVHYLVAFALWVLLPLIGLAAFIRRHTGSFLTGAAVVVFPAAAHSLLAGQNGILSALVVAGGLLNLERKPVLAGAILGLLSLKPHIAATVYAALLFGGYWRALGSALCVAFGLALASLIAFGADPWWAFVRESATAREFMESGGIRWSFMVAPFATARLAGLDVAVAYALQAVVSCGALYVLFAVWRRGDIPLEQRVAVLVTIVPLMSPYVFSYDIVMVGLALLWLGRTAWETGFRRGEPLVFALAWVAAPAGWVIADSTNVLLTPFVLIALLGVVLLRIPRTGAQGGLAESGLKAP